MRPLGLAARYTAFAAVATVVNLATQWLCFRLYRGPGELMVGVATGTATGLVSKYVLDKFWIFDDRSFGVIDNVNKFSQYTLTGILTTAIFWGTEAAFALAGTEAMRYVGAALGLTIGYILKFQLDRRFIFRVKP
jgi:putative flippase GtrA